jgi:hypothetical protein
VDEGVSYCEVDKDKAERVAVLWVEKALVRQMALGYIIQPVE